MQADIRSGETAMVALAIGCVLIAVFATLRVTQIADTELRSHLRVAAAVPHVGRPPLGLTGIPLFVVSLLLLLVVIMAFPQLSLWLPNLLLG